MNRIPKYRVWHKIEKRFVDLRSIDFVFENIGYDRDREFNYWEIESFDNIVFQQFTGKLDIEKNEMYEGDFVELILALQTHPETGEKNLPPDSYGLYEVIYDENEARFKLKIHRENNLFYHVYADNSIPISEVRGICKVIGNIFETPEL